MRWIKQLLLIVGSAVLMVGIVIGGGWLGTHQTRLQGLGPLVLIVGLGATIYGARSSAKKRK